MSDEENNINPMDIIDAATIEGCTVDIYLSKYKGLTSEEICKFLEEKIEKAERNLGESK